MFSQRKVSFRSVDIVSIYTSFIARTPRCYFQHVGVPQHASQCCACFLEAVIPRPQPKQSVQAPECQRAGQRAQQWVKLEGSMYRARLETHLRLKAMQPSGVAFRLKKA